MSLSWKPRRRGNIYCAPACGRGCTIQEYRNAHKQAERLAKRLVNVPTDTQRGRWKVNVWENLGWHWTITKGSVTLHKYSADSYAACLNEAGPWGGNAWANGKTPQLTVNRLLDSVRDALKPMVALAERLGAR